MPEHDNSDKLLFSHPEMVRDLLVGFVEEPWVEQLDLTPFEKASGSYVADDARAVLEPLTPLREQDRSKDVESAPWYHVDVNRINVHHLTPTEKRSAKVGEEA
jgi:hypothetical protein